MRSFGHRGFRAPEVKMSDMEERLLTELSQSKGNILEDAKRPRRPFHGALDLMVR